MNVDGNKIFGTLLEARIFCEQEVPGFRNNPLGAIDNQYNYLCKFTSGWYNTMTKERYCVSQLQSIAWESSLNPPTQVPWSGWTEQVASYNYLACPQGIRPELIMWAKPQIDLEWGLLIKWPTTVATNNMHGEMGWHWTDAGSMFQWKYSTDWENSVLKSFLRTSFVPSYVTWWTRPSAWRPGDEAKNHHVLIMTLLLGTKMPGAKCSKGCLCQYWCSIVTII